MKISEIRKKLEEFEKEVGDVEFVVMTEVDGRFCVESDRDIDIVTLPTEEDENLPEGPIVAVMNFGFDQVEGEE